MPSTSLPPFGVPRHHATFHFDYGPYSWLPTGCAVVYGTDVRLKKGKSDDEATMAHTTITVLGVIDVFGVFLEVERSGIDLFTVMVAG
jgi:hypothetical protein